MQISEGFWRRLELVIQRAVAAALKEQRKPTYEDQKVPRNGGLYINGRRMD